MAQQPTPRTESVVITDARSGTSKDQDQRMKRYAITMAFRTACFVGVIFVPGVLKWVLVAFAVFLPYVAVLFANQADTRSVAKRKVDVVEPEPLPQLTASSYETIPGETVADPDPQQTDPRTDPQSAGRSHRAA